MVLPGVGQYISLSNIQAELGGDNPILISEYYSSGIYATGISGVPSSGAINLSDFAGKSKPAVVGGGGSSSTNLVQNPSFTSTTSWTSATGWGATDNNSQLYNSNKPSIKLNDPGSTYPTYLMFSYPSSGQLVSQTITLTSPKSSYTFSYYVSTIMNRSITDQYFARAVFKNGSTTIHTIGITSLTSINWTNWQQQTYNTTINVSAATSVTIELSGYDAGFWNGNHGPRFAEVTLL